MTKKTKEKKVTSPSWKKIMKVNLDTVKDKEFCIKVAAIYEVPLMGIDLINGTPYLNRAARLYLLHDLKKERVVTIRTEFLNVALNPDDNAVCKKTIGFGLDVSEAVGEANKESVKLEGVKKTLNMMAETRALNRAIWQIISKEVMDRAVKNIVKMKLTKAEEMRILEATNVSYEEMNENSLEAKNTEVDLKPNELFEQAKKLIEGQNDLDELDKWSEDIGNKEDYTESQKADLISRIDKRYSLLVKKK